VVSPKAVPNRMLVVYALYLAGGSSKPVHTEDIAFKCFELFPTSFSWARYPQYPDKDIVRVSLTDARKVAHGSMVQGRSGQRHGLATKTQRGPAQDGWMLTNEGIRWVNENLKMLEDLVGAKSVKEHRQLLLKQLRRLRDHALFLRYLDNPKGFLPSIGDLADLLRCRVDAEPSVWNDRFDKAERQAQAAGQEDLIVFLTRCKEAYLRDRG